MYQYSWLVGGVPRRHKKKRVSTHDFWRSNLSKHHVPLIHAMHRNCSLHQDASEQRKLDQTWNHATERNTAYNWVAASWRRCIRSYLSREWDETSYTACLDSIPTEGSILPDSFLSSLSLSRNIHIIYIYMYTYLGMGQNSKPLKFWWASK